jgi:hypothetical protein
MGSKLRRQKVEILFADLVEVLENPNIHFDTGLSKPTTRYGSIF